MGSKQVRLAVLFFGAAAILVASPAFGAGTTLISTGIEENASGTAKLSGAKRIAIGDSGDLYRGTLTINCAGLVPNVPYRTTAGLRTSTDNGTLKIVGEVKFVVFPDDWGPTVYVEVYNAANQLVLAGGIYYK